MITKNLSSLGFQDLVELFNSKSHKATPPQKHKIENYIGRIKDVQDELKKLLADIRKWEDVTGLDFVKESSRGRFRPI